jgi:hypothetical protein
MSIHPFLSGQEFDPETIQKMCEALDRACNALGLKMVDDPATRFIAERVIEQAQRGVRDVSTLTALTLEEFQQSRSKDEPAPRRPNA